MTKKEIYKVRNQVLAAMASADNGKTSYSPLIRMEWKKYGYVPVSARHSI
jgi:hypothetical protein